MRPTRPARRRNWHDEHGDGEVGDGQTDDEVVGDGAQTPIADDGRNDQTVADQSQQKDREHSHRLDDRRSVNVTPPRGTPGLVPTGCHRVNPDGNRVLQLLQAATTLRCTMPVLLLTHVL